PKSLSVQMAHSLLFSWQFNSEYCTFAEDTVCSNRSAVFFNNIADDVKTETGAVFSSRPCFIGFIESFKYMFQILTLNTCTGVTDFDAYIVFIIFCNIYCNHISS